MESENRTDELTKWRRQDPEGLFTDAIADIVDVLKRLSVAVDQRDPVSVEGAVRLSVSMWSTAYSAHRQLIQRSEGDPADRSSSLLEARESLLELSAKATMEMATSRLYSLLDELQETFSIVDAEGTPGASRSRAGHHRRHAPVLAYHLADGTRASFPREDKDGQAPPGTTQREPLFTVVRVDPDFRPEIYNAMFTALQGEPHAKVLDLTPARLLCADVFERLGAAWTVPPEVVPRLAILMSFDRWVTLREAALAALQPLIVRGVRVEVFYEEQSRGGQLANWFSHGQVAHAVALVVATLAAGWEPPPSWSIVLDALARLVRAHGTAHELPELLVEVAELALSCGGADQAATLAREALLYLPPAPSATRSKALRELGTALMGLGQAAAGFRLLEEAIMMAALVNEVSIGAIALSQSGLYLLNHGDYPGAERRFRRAIELLSGTWRPQLLARVHHNLALSLLHQGKGEAELHAKAALALRPDPESHLAEEDRMLLSRLLEVRGDAN